MRNIICITGIISALFMGCDREVPAENPSCCIYECVAPRMQWFSDHFGSEEQCQMLAASRCSLEFPDEPELMWFEFEGGVSYDDVTGLNSACEARFFARTSTVGA